MFFKRTGRIHRKSWRLINGTCQYRSTTRFMQCSRLPFGKTLLPFQPPSVESFAGQFAILKFLSTSSVRQDQETKPDTPLELLRIERELDKLHHRAHSILTSAAIPSQDMVQTSLETCELLAESLIEGAEATMKVKTPASHLLNLEEHKKRKDVSMASTRALGFAMRQRAVHRLSKSVYDIVNAPQVFITPELLSSYVRTQSLLGRPETIPPVFVLYASKPIPLPDTSPVQYQPSNPKKASFAIPLSSANTALDSAIEQRNLSVCFDIINTSVCTSAFRRLKLFNRALAPICGLALAPAAAYSAASQWSLWQDTMDNQLARNVMFAGLLAYASFTTTLGVVAITTANDQMERITWATGTPLRERWLREEERAMIDRVACAWGFQETWRRGEEEGRDWQRLREWTGLRCMVLDKIELMEGME